MNTPEQMPTTSDAVAPENPVVVPETPNPVAEAPLIPPVAEIPAVAPIVTTGMLAPTVPPSPQPNELSRIAQDFQIRKVQVEAVVQLVDEGNTVPFITRYRKERTGGLDEEMIRKIMVRVASLRAMAERKQTILKSIATQGKLTGELVEAVMSAEHLKRLEDLYLPFKPKKRTLATEARERGLEPLAKAIWANDPAVAALNEVLPGMINPDKQLADVDAVIAGVRHIIAEMVSEFAEIRGPLRAFFRDTAVLTTLKADDVTGDKGQDYRDYFDFKEDVRMMPPHRIMAVNRGEHEKIIKAKLTVDIARAKDIALHRLPLADHPHREFILPAIEDSLDRLVLPSLEREIRKEMTEFAQEHAIDIFARNLRSLLLRAPLGGKRVLALDPGLRTGCKVAVLDETGVMLEECVIYPHPPVRKPEEAKLKLEQLIRKYQTGIVAIGNGTGCRETEQMVSELIAAFEERRVNPTPKASPVASVVSETPTIVDVPTLPTVDSSATMVSAPVLPAESIVAGVTGGAESSTITPTDAAPATSVQMPTDAAPAPAAPPPMPPISLDGLPEPPPELAYVIVNEAGASDYSASPVAKEEFPELDATVRGTISIGRRLQDPLAELVKIDPQHVGVGLYQHDIKPKQLKESLESVIETCVNAVGVDVNTASIPLLRHVSGLNQLVARELVEFRKKNGPFNSREQLKQIPQMGDVRFTQSAGFLKVRSGGDPLDETWIHPESYHIARQILESMGHTPADLRDKAKLAEIREKLKSQNPEAIANIHKVGGPTIRDIFDAIDKPNRDLRDDRAQPIFRKGVLNLEDLKPGMELKGEVLNVVDFGAFVDVGLKDSGLVHISQMANRFIKSPYDVIAVGDVVPVWVMTVDAERKRVSLSMIQPGQERKPQEPRPPQGERPPRPPRQDRPPMGERPPRQDRPPMGPRPDGPPRQDQRPPMGPRPAGDRPGYAPRPTGPGGPPQGPRPYPPRGGPPRPPMGTPAPRPNQGYTPPPQPQVPLTPPKPKKPKPIPKLSSDQKEGKAALNTFAQLAAFFTPPAPPVPPTPVAPPAPVVPQTPAVPPPEAKVDEKPPETTGETPSQG